MSDLAKAIARELFLIADPCVSSERLHCDRLAQKVERADGEVELGGWCESSVVYVIDKHLRGVLGSAELEGET